MTRDRPQPLIREGEAFRTDGGEVNNRSTDEGVLAVIESVDVRTYDSAEAVSDPLAEGEQIASPFDYGFDITVETVTETATTHTPARISITIEYVGEEPIPYSGGPRFGRYFVTNFNSTTGLHLYPTEATIDRKDDRCWIVDPLGEGMSFQWGEIQPHSSREVEYNIVADPEKNICYPIGEHKILQKYSLSKNPFVYWGLVIELSRP
ncbi:hypothetical protein [Halomontanus rarus]|uniref:hypothetical protein n=1 Tax=Halomontanus rarus TaxID=3034020 RepID=UPI0023E8B73A|nr:hypothetical protein [Halovivax sp. TS33]